MLYVCYSDNVMFNQDHELGTIFFDILALPVSLPSNCSIPLSENYSDTDL